MVLCVIMKLQANEMILTEKIVKFALPLGGVFSLSDLYQLMEEKSLSAKKKKLAKLITSKIILRWQRGIFSTQNFDPWLLAHHLNPKGYISLDSVLSKNGLAGTISKQSVSLVIPLRNRIITKNNFTFSFYKAASPLFFGYSRNEQGVAVADNEKAYLDLLYFYVRGYRFSVDPFIDVNLNKLNKEKYFLYLKKYNNPKFAKFAERMFYGK